MHLKISSNADAGLTTIADLAKIDDRVKTQAEAIYPNTFVKAQQYNLQMQKESDDDYMPHCYYGNQWPYFPHGWHPPPFHQMNGFLNEYVYGYYDDEGKLWS